MSLELYLPRVSPDGYTLVKLASGVYSVHSLAHGETFHPVIGPVAEAEALYLKQLRLRDRLQNHAGEFVIWDVGLGAGANVLTVLRGTRDLDCSLRVISFDHTLEPLRFALEQAAPLEYPRGFERELKQLLDTGHAQFSHQRQHVNWQVQLADFPALIRRLAESRSAATPETHLPPPHAIFFDAFSPATNPAMWTLPLFGGLFSLLDPRQPCAMPTYSRSTMLRVTLLLAGFYVGAGHATGEKEETTIAANTLELIDEPLDAKWLGRAQRSRSAEPMREPLYRQQPLSAETWERLRAHAQFS